MNKEGEKEQAEFLNSENRRMINYHSCKSSDVTLKGTVSENKLSAARLVLEDNLQITNNTQLEWKYNLYLKPDLANMKSVEVGTRKDKHYQDVNQ